MPYEARLDRNNPTCLVFLVDQSASMADLLPGQPVSRAAVVADQINGLLYELIQRCTKSLNEPPRPYFAVGVVGYGTDGNGVAQVRSALTGSSELSLAWTPDLAERPLRLEERTRSAGGGDQRYVMPVWVDALASGGTPMCAAMDAAGRLVRSWVDQYPNSFPPIVINFSDGESTDGDPSGWATRLRGLRTNDGGLLLFNLHLASTPGAVPTLFSSAPQPGWSPYSVSMFEMSSELPPVMAAAARAQGFSVAPGARGFGLNADFRAVVSFLNIGTSIAHLLR